MPRGQHAEVRLDLNALATHPHLVLGTKWMEKIGYEAPRRDFYDPFGQVDS